MAARLWGKKIGMTQIFTANKVVPVTAIDIANWIITNVKTKERDGYNAVQVGLLRDRYTQKAFDSQWLKLPNEYFTFVREISVGDDTSSFIIGQPVDFKAMLTSGESIDIVGRTKGHGFAGVIRRHNFKGGPASHGSDLGKKPGSSSSYRSQGRIIKGKKFPGHMGFINQMMRNLEVVKIDGDANIILVKGSVPGKAGSLLSIRKSLE